MLERPCISWTTACLAVFGLLLFACDKGGEPAEGGGPTEATTAGAAEQPAEQPATTSPAELGREMGRLYIAAMLELKNLVTARPALDELRPQLDETFERNVQLLVSLGYQREALDEAGRAASDSALTRVLWSEAEEQLGGVEWLTEAVNHYRPMDNEVANRISAFNIITQYANFELLRRQAPAEAERLGIPQPPPVESPAPQGTAPAQP
ncbi:MAG: hypothetical protein JW797_01765 [Bradymonadales bacterium]|nr:hypothetical protein [Bradymonadales bacterium]